MIKHLLSIAAGVLLITLVGCEDSEPKDPEPVVLEIQEPKAQEEVEIYLDELDYNDSMETGNSLYYSRGEGETSESVEVKVYMNDSNQVVKMEEIIVAPGSNTVTSNRFYFRNDKKVATKRFFQEKVGDEFQFVEIRSFYDADETVKVTKRRTAPYEELLDGEMFKVTRNEDCKADRAFQILNQEGEFVTTFQGFIDMGGFIYLIVGEDKKNGFATSLIVQMVTPYVQELRRKEKEMIGTPLEVQFETITDSGGSEQILHAVRKK
ncbi:MAG: hypothetical protein ACI837_002872 [Crocinitomicaceae bacterium]|jgi:hypothetical protein